jgi:RimJ/RimL family protein N-acetyltransferase
VEPDWPIETERLVLRPYREDDLGGLHAIFSDVGVVRWLYYDVATLDDSKLRLARKISGRELTEDTGLAAAVELHDGTFVADVVLFYSEPAEHRSVELGYSCVPAHQGHGYVTEAARAIVDWAFASGLHRVYACLEPRNTASARVVEKLGMRKEALLVENEWVKGEWQSELVYAILDREWQR